MNPDELRETLVGAWRLVSYRATAVDDGEVVQPFGPRPQGLITYTPSGHMSAQIMRPLRPRFRQGRLEKGLPEELAAAAVGYLAYGGTYEVPEDDLVVHHVELSLFPNWVGTTQARVADRDGDGLRLSLPEPAPIWGARRTGVLVWERAR
ncbi:lipocalin-like domain-containing protein [Streptomyces sp. NBC_01571]|uniref:lipocalin-like domain-containing protein n=1 Tax=Streptomyces sp. NBC_01571 TaxID=2975883 RepID=UPI0022557435|nr:lipocalin-like domain-containing protein [Streptomyces sp. NBC_01571]MCX4579413.1 lipocalin-like domain-containing protein [Streptomyces sp. NBC_01571]